MVFPAPGSNDFVLGVSGVKRQSVSGVFKKERILFKVFYFKGFLHHAAPVVNSVVSLFVLQRLIPVL
jgi:hypothetical protein